MIVALIDNGSLEPAAHLNLRAVAAALSKRAGVTVHPVSWKHSDRIPAGSAGLRPAAGSGGPEARAPIWTLAPFIRAQVARGECEFLLIPFFISAQGAIGSALRSDLEKLSGELGGFSFTFTDGLAARGALAPIVADRVRETIAANKLSQPAVIVVDHGGPSLVSAELRDAICRSLLAGDSFPAIACNPPEADKALPVLCRVAPTIVRAASMEGSHPPLLADELRRSEYENRDVVVAMLFLSPGRHAGPDGDVAQICQAARSRCHLTALVGDHPIVVATLSAALRDALALTVPVEAGRHVS